LENIRDCIGANDLLPDSLANLSQLKFLDISGGLPNFSLLQIAALPCLEGLALQIDKRGQLSLSALLNCTSGRVW